MAGYDYSYRSGYSTGNGVGSYTDQWGQTRHGSPPLVEPVRNYGYAADDNWRRPPSPPHHAVDGFHTRIHTDASRDPRVAPFNGITWGQQPNQIGYNGTTGYGGYSDYSNNTLYKPNGNTIRNDNYDDYHHNRKHDSGMGPINLTSHGGYHGKSSHSTWISTLPVRGDGRLSIPTDDMERALHYLKESAKSSAWPRTT
ncbi:hypothetical protein ACE6H2_022337 [Prunus campanulata]